MRYCEVCGQFISEAKWLRHKEKRCERNRYSKEMKKMVNTSKKGGFKLMKRDNRTVMVPISPRRIALVPDDIPASGEFARSFTLGKIEPQKPEGKKE